MSNTELSAPPIPPLVEGDRLTAAEFERRYDAMPEVKKAELIEGVVYMSSPVSVDDHGTPHTFINHWIAAYWLATPGMQAADNSTVRLDGFNMPQPDVFLFILRSHGGRAGVGKDGYLDAAPDLIVEVAASSASLDMNAKLRVYQGHGVREYVVWRTEKGQLDWFVLRGKKFDRLTPNAAGLLCSEAFPGLWLDAAALLAGDYPGVMAALQRGIADPAHAAFVAELRSRAGAVP